MTSHYRVAILFATLALISCKTHSSKESHTPFDPTRCKVVDIGEATDLAEKSSIDDNRMVLVHGLAHPRALVWRDATTGFTFYITRVMGTKQRLFFLRQIKPDEKPHILSELQGYLLRWDKLPKKKSSPIANALASQYKIIIKPESTYVIDESGKPAGCP